jgi:hypothetical protein
MLENVLNQHPVSEAIAHYCQYKYLLEFGTKAQRIGVIGSVTKDHLLLRALVATDTLAGPPQLFHVESILKHNALAEYRAVYRDEAIRYLLRDYEGKLINGLYFLLAEARMGAILALHLINNGTAIRQLCTVKTDGTARELLDRLGLNTEELLDFSQADILLRKFIDGK